jgi:hypothetical protein
MNQLIASFHPERQSFAHYLTRKDLIAPDLFVTKYPQYSVLVEILSVKRVTVVLSFREGTHNQLVSSAKESGSASVSFSLIVICVGQLFGVRDYSKTLVT